MIEEQVCSYYITRIRDALKENNPVKAYIRLEAFECRIEEAFRKKEKNEK